MEILLNVVVFRLPNGQKLFQIRCQFLQRGGSRSSLTPAVVQQSFIPVLPGQVHE